MLCSWGFLQVARIFAALGLMVKGAFPTSHRLAMILGG